MISPRLRSAALSLAVVVGGVARGASAQAATVVETPGELVTHALPSGQDFARDPTLNPSGINYEDCERDVTFTFPITVSDAIPGVDQLFVYAGNGCANAAERTGVVGDTCWQVVNGAVPYTPDQAFTITLPVRQILSQLYTGVSQQFIASTDDTVCHEQSTSAAQPLDVFFIVTDVTGAVTEAVATATVGADLSAAIVPPNFALDIGNDELLPKWGNVSDSDIAKYNVYYQVASTTSSMVLGCADAGEADGEADDADAGEGGVAASCATMSNIDTTPQASGDAQPFSPTGLGCASPFPLDDPQPAGAAGLTSSSTSDSDGGEAGITTVTSSAGSIGPLAFQPQEYDPSSFQLLTAASGATGATIPGLLNHTQYVVAVAAVDSYGNVGALTSSTGMALCQAPLPTTDFFSSYKGDDGAAGGCSIGDTELPGGAGFASLIAGVACVTVLRRRRRSA